MVKNQVTKSIERRKEEHIKWCLTDDVLGMGITTGFEKVTFLHNALPEVDFDTLSLETSFLGKSMNTPFLISSMTGGAKEADFINENLARACQTRGWALGLGSTRAYLEDEKYRKTFKVRKYAPTIPVIANLGAVSLNYGVTAKMCQHIVDETEASALVLHLNGLQEVMQTDGDTNFSGLLVKIEQVVKHLSVPVGVKEVGFGIAKKQAKQLKDVGVSFIDVAGAGGTSWTQVEKLRSNDVVKIRAAEAFTSWGVPTVKSLIDCVSVKDVPVIASGGIKTGVDACKALGLGADLVGFARGILKDATTSAEAVLETMAVREMELKMAMFGIGVNAIADLKQSEHIRLDI